MSNKHWSSGPREILEHGIELLQKDTDSSRRLAFLAIDNAVELTVKTFLGLPKRITGLTIGRKQFDEITNSFPKMLELLAEHANARLTEIHIGEIEWFHRLRNELYHNGNGLTVERIKVSAYAGIAVVLFEKLFEEQLSIKGGTGIDLIARYFGAWGALDRVLREWYQRYAGSVLAGANTPRQLAKKGVMDREVAERIEQLRVIRNRLTHDRNEDVPLTITADQIESAKQITEDLRSRLAKES